MSLRLCVYSVFVLGLFTVQVALASAQDAAAELTKKLAGFEALHGDFTQRQYTADQELIQESSGSFTMQPPGLLRWETTEPFPQVLMSNGDQVWLYDPDLEQVTISKLDQNSLNTPAVILSNNAEELRKKFVVEATENGFILKPKDTPQTFTALEIVFAAEQLSSMIVSDSLGQETQFLLANVQSRPLDSVQAYEFKVPVGVDVLIHD